MAKQAIDMGTGPDTPGADTLNSGFTKVNANFDELYIRNGEYTPAGVLVYPYINAQTVVYASGIVDYVSTSYDSKTWTLGPSAYNAVGQVTEITATDSITEWTKTIAYTNGVVSSEGEWTT